MQAAADGNDQQPWPQRDLLRIGLVGHRIIDDAATVARITAEARAYFAQWRDQFATLRVFTQLAIGADMLLAEVALEFGAQLVAVIPFATFHEDFTGDDLVYHHRLRSQAQHVEHRPFGERSNEAYWEAGKWTVDASDVILAAWDGQPSRGIGGTADVVRYALDQHKPVHIIATPR